MKFKKMETYVMKFAKETISKLKLSNNKSPWKPIELEMTQIGCLF